MSSSHDPRPSPGRWVRTTLLHAALVGCGSILRALPARWVLGLADALALLVYAIDARGRRVGRQNLRAVFGEGCTPGRRREILRACFRNNLRSLLLLTHVAPLTRERYLRWVDVPEDVERRFRESLAASAGGVLVSGHLGNWELLLGLPAVFEGMPDLIFLAEGNSTPAVERYLGGLRGTGGGRGVLRQGGARALSSHVRRGGAAALLADRNVRRSEGGIWAPFLGLMASTTPLPAWLALRNHVHLRPVLCLPTEDGRYRIWVGPNLTEGVDASDRDAAVLEVTNRINRVLEEVVRARPELWNWTLKRFKSRPERDLGAYPPYSLWDP